MEDFVKMLLMDKQIVIDQYIEDNNLTDQEAMFVSLGWDVLAKHLETGYKLKTLNNLSQIIENLPELVDRIFPKPFVADQENTDPSFDEERYQREREEDKAERERERADFMLRDKQRDLMMCSLEVMKADLASNQRFTIADNSGELLGTKKWVALASWIQDEVNSKLGIS